MLENRQLHNVNIDNAIKNGTVTANHKTSASSENVSLFSGNSFIRPDKEVTITDDFVRLAVSGVSIKTQPNQTVYEVNNQLILAGLCRN